MFTDSTARLIAEQAKAAGITPSRLLAVVECETNGSPFEVDNHTPSFLYERHVAYREAKAVSGLLLNAFIAAGLAIPKWSKSTQYKDERTSAMRLTLIARAREIDEEVANRSASWGLGQTMGNECHALGFNTATELVEYMLDYGLKGQVDLLIREINSKKLVNALNRGDFATFALRYNGPGYRQNQYDTRMAAADKRWARKLDTVVARVVTPPHQSFSRKQMESLQKQLAALGYTMVGRTDGDWGPNTVAALSAFQHAEGLGVTGEPDADTMKALEAAEPRVQSADRANATVDDLRGKSKTIDAAEGVTKTGVGKIIAGTVIAGGSTAEQGGLLGQAQDTVEKVDQAKGLWDTVHGWLEPVIGNPTSILIGVALIVVGFVVWKYGKAIIEARLEDHRSGAHTGNDT